MGKKFSKLLGIFLALAMILTAIPGNAFAAGNNSGEGTLQPGDTRIPVTVKMTLNKVYDWNEVNGSVAKGIAVKGNVQFYWVYTGGAAPVFENANIDGTTSNVKWIKGSETVFFEGLPDKVGNVTVADYTKLSLVALLKEDNYKLTHPVNAAEIAEPSIENPYRKGQHVYKLGEVKFDAEGNVVKDSNMIVRDFAVSFRNAKFGETVITVFDKVTRKPLKGVKVVFSNVKVDGDKYVMTNDAGMNYIDNKDVITTYTVATDDNGQIFLTKAAKDTIATLAKNDVVAVKAELPNGYAYTSVSFLSLKTPLDGTDTPNTSYISLFLSNAAPAPFEVRVRYQDGTKPYAAAAGITVKVLSNESKIFGQTKMGEAVFTGKTDENGYVEIPAAALTNSTEVYLNEKDNTQLNPEYLVRKNFIVLYDENGKELATSPAVPYMVTDEDIENNFKDFTFTTGSRLPFGRLAGSNRFETAVSVAKEQYPNGLTGNVIIARADDFADCLTANGLAYVYDAPILLTATNELSKETAAYLEAQNDKINNVIVMGLTNAIDGQVSKKLESIGRVVRVGGDNRFETAISAADMIYNGLMGDAETAPLNPTVVRETDRADMGTFFLANGWNFPDALIASVPAARYGYPILLTDKAPLTKVTRDYLSAQKQAGYAKRVVVFGGEDVIAENTKATIDVSTVSRIAGKSRYETNTEANTIFFADVTKLYVVSGTRYSDALVAGKLAAENNAGVLMVNPNGLDKETIEYLKNSKVTDFILVGGEDVIPTKVAEQIFDVIAGR